MQPVVMNSDEDPLANPVLGLRSGTSGSFQSIAVTPSYDSPDVDPFGIEMRTPMGEKPSLPDMRYDPELQVSVPLGIDKKRPELIAGGPPPPPQATRCGWIYLGTNHGFYSYEDPKWVLYYP